MISGAQSARATNRASHAEPTDFLRETSRSRNKSAVIFARRKKVCFHEHKITLLPHVSFADPSETVSQVPGLRVFSDEGTLVIPPFRSEDYRQDVHAVVYRCVATNNVGSITSRDVHVSAGKYERCRAISNIVTRGGCAVLKCV